MSVVLLIALFAFLSLTSGCQTNSAPDNASIKSFFEQHEKEKQAFKNRMKESDARVESFVKQVDIENAPFYKAKAEYEEWYGSLNVSKQRAVDSLLEQKLIHRRNIQGPNGVGVYDVWHDRFEIMAEYKEFFSH